MICLARRPIRWTACAVGLLGLFLGTACRAVQAQVENVIRESSFVFHGTVLRANASNISAVPGSDNTAVVRVDRVVHNPGSLDDFTGRAITVQLTDSQMREGQEVVFVTEVVLYGETLLVQEQGRIQATTRDSAAVDLQVQSALMAAADRELQTRINDAELVVVGRVGQVRPPSDQRLQGPGTEHDPDWREAVIAVESVEKGTPGDPLIVLFANSRDVVWDLAPKFEEGQEGIWILRRGGVEGLGIDEYLTALDPLDYQTRDQLSRIRSLVGRQ